MTLVVKIKKTLIFSLFGIILLMLVSSPQIIQADSDIDAVAGQLIVEVKPGVLINDITQTYGISIIDTLKHRYHTFLVQVPEDRDLATLLSQMMADSRLVYVEPNLMADTPEAVRSKGWAWGGEDDQPYENQYALTHVNLATTHQHSQGANIVVAIIDTGVQLDHPALSAQLSDVQADFVDNDNLADDTANGIDDDHDGQIDEATGHGTHIAGTIHLVAPQATLMPIRVLNSDGRGNIFDIAAGIRFAVAHKADVINLSLGTLVESELLEEVIEEAMESGVVVVAAAGNLGTSQAVYPAADACTISVTAIGPNNAKANFANYGTWVDLAAPGETIYSTFPRNGYAHWSGTSMATPFVTGQIALLRSYNPNLSVHQVESLLSDTAQSIASENPGLDSLIGAGKIDIWGSMSEVMDDVPSTQGQNVDLDCSDQEDEAVEENNEENNEEDEED
ncbi:MAG: S8 family serine peptidase [Chloroflexota bacterium]